MPVLLSGCIPPGLTIASYAVDGVSYLGTGKSLTDHMLSDLEGRDCATWRVLKSRPICHDFTPEQIAERKRNRDSIRHDVDKAYIATNLDGIDLDSGTGLAAKDKPAAKPVSPRASSARASSAASSRKAAAKPIALKPASFKPARAKPVLVKREALPSQRRPELRRVVLRRPADSRYLVFGSFRKRPEAVKFASRHASVHPAILPVRVRGTRYYRVVVRPDGHQALAAARQHLRRNGVKDAYTMRVCHAGASSAHCMKPIATTHQSGRPAAQAVTGGG